MKRDMINISMQRYGTRMLTADEPFEASRRDARVLHALKRARYATESDAEGQREDAEAADLAQLRREYQDKLGKRPFAGWSADELRAKIAAGTPTGND